MKDFTHAVTTLGLALVIGCAAMSPSSLAEEKRAVMDEGGVQRIEVAAGNYWFRPDHIIVKANAPVVLVVSKQTAIVPHTFVIHAPEAGIDIDLRLSSKGQGVYFTPTKPGTYPFYCSKKGIFGNHRAKGMEGVLEVVE